MEEIIIFKKIGIVLDNELSNDTIVYNFKGKGRRALVGVGSDPIILENTQDWELDSPNVSLLLKLYANISTDSNSQKYFFEILYNTFNKNSKFNSISYLSFQVLVRLNKIDEAIDILIKEYKSPENNPLMWKCFHSISGLLKFEHNLINENTLDLLNKYVLGLSYRIGGFEQLPDNLEDYLSEEYLSVESYEVRTRISLALIKEQIKQIMYLRLKKELSDKSIVEINQDKVRVQQYLKQFNFSKDLQDSLDRFEVEYNKASDDFDYKNCIGHVRSFFENLGEEIVIKVVSKVNMQFNGDLKKAINVRDYLKQINFISDKEHHFHSSLYGLISSDGVHPLKADRETARLCKNMIIEYSLILLERINNFK